MAESTEKVDEFYSAAIRARRTAVDDHRLFRLDRIIELQSNGRRFKVEPHQSLEAYIRQYDPEFVDRAF